MSGLVRKVSAWRVKHAELRAAKQEKVIETDILSCLQNVGMLEISQLPTIDFCGGELYRVFDPKGRNWTGNFSKNFLINVHPALELATRFLYIPHLLPWWRKLCFGKVVRDDILPDNPTFYFEDVPASMNPDFGYTFGVFDELTEYITLSWDAGISVGPPAGVQGSTHFGIGESTSARKILYPSFINPQWPEAYPNVGFDNIIKIHPRNMEYFSREDIPLTEYYHTLFRVAMILVHELAHAIEHFRLGPGKKARPSVWHSLTDLVPEIGTSWEQNLFPYHTTQNLPVLGQNATARLLPSVIWATPWPSKSDTAARHWYTSVSTPWLAQLFTEGFWSSVRKMGWQAVKVELTKLTRKGNSFGDGDALLYLHDMLIGMIRYDGDDRWVQPAGPERVFCSEVKGRPWEQVKPSNPRYLNLLSRARYTDDRITEQGNIKHSSIQ